MGRGLGSSTERVVRARAAVASPSQVSLAACWASGCQGLSYSPNCTCSSQILRGRGAGSRTLSFYRALRSVGQVGEGSRTLRSGRTRAGLVRCGCMQAEASRALGTAGERACVPQGHRPLCQGL